MGDKRSAPAIASVEGFTLRMPPAMEAAFERELGQARKGTLEDVRRAMVNLKGAINKVGQIRAYTNKAQYPNHPFGNSMADVARMIAGNLGSQVYYTNLGGWDTHAAQQPRQAELLGYLAQTLSAFRQDMKAIGKDKDVLLMVFSEFGRRVEENASHGTDHGKGGLMLVLGGGVKGGLYGSEPDLEDLDDGDLKYRTDFRNVYASSLQWIAANPKEVLGGEYRGLNLF
jgi:uncharacterized protein (DUF1501 family)